MDNPVIKCILDRHCSREFVDGELPQEDLETLVEAMRWAPSAGNLQPWFFYIVKNREMKKALAESAHGQKFLVDAAVVVVICAVPSRSIEVYKDRGLNLYSLQDTAAAAENLMVAAESMGYGCCWVGAFDETAASEALGLPDEHRPVAIMPVGPSMKATKRTARYSTNEICKVLD